MRISHSYRKIAVTAENPEDLPQDSCSRIEVKSPEGNRQRTSREK